MSQKPSVFEPDEILASDKNVILFPAPADRISESSGELRTRERLGGLLRFYHREAA